MRHVLIPGLIICLVCLPPCYVQAAVAKAKSETSRSNAKAVKKQETKKTKVVLLTIKGAYPEGPKSEGLFGELQPSLSSIIRRMDAAAEDDQVAAVWLRIEPLAMGFGKINELRCAVGRLRKAGKPVCAELTTAGSAQYLLAAACDEIIMPPCGMLIVPGVRTEVTFYKGLLDKLGIRADMLQMGKYKGAAEPLTRTSMSGPLRESMEAIVDDTYEGVVEVIAADRQMKDYKVKTVLDEGMFTAAAALKAGLIDHVAYADVFQESLRKQLKADEIELVTNYKKKKVETDFSGLTGMMKLMELIVGSKTSAKPGKEKKIAVVYAVGPIVEGKSTSDLLGGSTLGSTTLVKALRKAADDEQVAAIVLRIDSPGGSAVASDLIWRETVRIRKPIIASMGDVAGSGGYYIAMGCDRIIAEPGTITGSIGVVGGKLVLGGLYEKIGLTTEVISRGKLSGSLSMTEPFTPEERKAWTALLNSTYRQFVRKAAEGRKMDPRELSALAQGRVYTGRMAAGNGLVDKLGTLRDAVAAAKQAAGIKKDEKVELMILPRPKTIFELLFGDPSAELESALDLKATSPEVIELARKAKLFRQLFTEPTLLWMPYAVEVK